MRTLGADVDSRENNFDVLRLGAAALVLVSHSWALTGRPEPVFAGTSLGELGVTMFFAISGYLVARSWHMDPRPQAYIVKRFLRLWPGLVLVLVVTAAFLGPLLTNLSLGDYFGSNTSEYVLRNVTLHIQYTLADLFAHNPSPSAVNGSLWTLPLEVKAYSFVLVLGLTRLLGRPWVLVLIVAAFTWVLSASPGDRPHIAAQLLVGPLQTRLLLAFVGASLLFAIRDRLPLDWRVAIAAALAAWFTARASTAVHAIAWTVAVPYLMVFLAYRTPSALRRLVRPGDLSYGIYLWAFPVQQAVISILGAGVAPGWVLLVAGTITYVAAFISWRLIEAPALRLKQRLRVKGAARPTPALA